MLYVSDNKGNFNEIESIPRKQFFEGVKAQLDAADPNAFEAIMGRLEEIFDGIDAKGPDEQVECSSFMPGRNWNGTPFQPIHNVCVDGTTSAFFFGICVWIAAQRHEKAWSVSDNTPNDIPGKTYFRINIPGAIPA